MKPESVILLSGTPTAGKYEKLWSQVQLLGWKSPRMPFGTVMLIHNGLKMAAGSNRKLSQGIKCRTPEKETVTVWCGVYENQ